MAVGKSHLLLRKTVNKCKMKSINIPANTQKVKQLTFIHAHIDIIVTMALHAILCEEYMLVTKCFFIFSPSQGQRLFSHYC